MNALALYDAAEARKPEKRSVRQIEAVVQEHEGGPSKVIKLNVPAYDLEIKDWRGMLMFELAGLKLDVVNLECMENKPEFRSPFADPRIRAGSPGFIIALVNAKCQQFSLEPLPAWVSEPLVRYLYMRVSPDRASPGERTPQALAKTLWSRNQTAITIREHAENLVSDYAHNDERKDDDDTLPLDRKAWILSPLHALSDAVQGVRRDEQDRFRARLQDLDAKPINSARARDIVAIYRTLLSMPISDEETDEGTVSHWRATVDALVWRERPQHLTHTPHPTRRGWFFRVYPDTDEKRKFPEYDAFTRKLARLQRTPHRGELSI